MSYNQPAAIHTVLAWMDERMNPPVLLDRSSLEQNISENPMKYLLLQITANVSWVSIYSYWRSKAEQLCFTSWHVERKLTGQISEA